ncbi:hypothetical protein VOLCADRAFT_107469 [Volvox carteri f. nagariensis]|uniref:Uncharacterized protein n=1 Tax=Volvox carteri f. nagariensis TaxID=3068 RepID=D8UE65_VOLCA|nr:uncharacterized protein VOLCADRAFT_107469 [Volvox carteri f. nagariensis]EFJ41953.1 hypothetical protein VOLCADRAFT_107469 [Volvox carteri f. nagariensis]|eukprot:XP_002956990.1 hypothetical protein VOLCADRAFT_107469 [Volvox carteri f. nagariensis]
MIRVNNLAGAHSDAGIKAIASDLGADIKGKVLIDATNPLSPYPGLEVRWTGKSAGELLAEELPDTFVYKAFNTIGANLMAQGDGSSLNGQQLTMMFAGSSENKALVEEVISTTGFEPVYVGSIRYARNLELREVGPELPFSGHSQVASSCVAGGDGTDVKST